MENLEHQLKVESRLSKLETQLTGQDDKLDLILVQVTLTNSRVSKLEVWKAISSARNKWVAGVIGFFVSAFTAIGLRFWIQ